MGCLWLEVYSVNRVALGICGVWSDVLLNLLAQWPLFLLVERYFYQVFKSMNSKPLTLTMVLVLRQTSSWISC